MLRLMSLRQVDLPRWSHYAIAVVLTGLVVALRFAAAPFLGDTGPFFLSSLAVLISAFIGGLWPGLFATVLTTAAGTFFFLSPSGPLDFSEPKTRIIFAAQLTVCFCVSLICGALRSSEKTAAAIAQEKEGALSKLSSLFNSITDALITLTPDRRVIAYNESAGKLFGLTEASNGKRLTDALPATLAGALDGPLASAAGKAAPLSLEVHDERSERSYEVRGFTNDEGFLVYFHDITERLANNEAISSLAGSQERANAQLDSLLTHAPLGFAFFDRQGRCERVNGVLADINGFAAEAHLGKTIREVLPFDGPDVEEIIAKVFETQQAVDQIEFEGPGVGESVRRRHWHTGFYPVTNAGGVSSVGAIVLEITQRKEVEERLRESEIRFRNLADNAPMMIWVCRPNVTPTWFNRPWLEFRGLTLEEALADDGFAHLHPEDATWVDGAYKEAFRKGEPLAVEYRVKNGIGEYRWLLVRASPVLGMDGAVDSYLVSSVDVTDRIHAEEAMRKSLANERSARSDAERANRLKDEFLASLSHELRTPLTTMLGWTELLMRPHVRETELTDGLEIIHRSTKLQLQLINDLLDMSRISVGKLTLNLEFAELFDIVESVVHLIRPTATAKKITVKSQMPKEPIVVRLDADRFTQILWNLLTNAIKFTPSGGQITLTLDSDSEFARVAVSDTGVGIEEEFLEYAFDRFRQEDGTRSRIHGGMGLGLSIVKQLTELHGGTVTVQSEGKNRGACFIVSIPLANNLTPLPSANDPDEEVKIKVPKLRGVCVLVVEDDRPSRELFRRMLEMEGATVIAAGAASEARRLMDETRPDVLVSDIGLPEEDGFTFVKNLRNSQEPGMTNIPAIALTAFAGMEDKERAFEAGFQVFLAKPVDPADLVAAVSQLKPPVSV